MAKKVRLREFQEYLAQRLSGAARGDAAAGLLGVESGGQHWLIDLTESGEVVPFAALSDVPLTQSWFAGIANIRGNLFAVVDFAAFRGLDPTPRNAQSRLLLIGTRFGINTALLVRRMLGLRALDTMSPASDAGQQPAWVRSVLVDAQGTRWHLLDVPALLADPTYMQVER